MAALPEVTGGYFPVGKAAVGFKLTPASSVEDMNV